MYEEDEREGGIREAGARKQGVEGEVGKVSTGTGERNPALELVQSGRTHTWGSIQWK